MPPASAAPDAPTTSRPARATTCWSCSTSSVDSSARNPSRGTRPSVPATYGERWRTRRPLAGTSATRAGRASRTACGAPSSGSRRADPARSGQIPALRARFRARLGFRVAVASLQIPPDLVDLTLEGDAIAPIVDDVGGEFAARLVVGLRAHPRLGVGAADAPGLEPLETDGARRLHDDHSLVRALAGPPPPPPPGDLPDDPCGAGGPAPRAPGTPPP